MQVSTLELAYSGVILTFLHTFKMIQGEKQMPSPSRKCDLFRFRNFPPFSASDFTKLFDNVIFCIFLYIFTFEPIFVFTLDLLFTSFDSLLFLFILNRKICVNLSGFCHIASANSKPLKAKLSMSVMRNYLSVKFSSSKCDNICILMCNAPS